MGVQETEMLFAPVETPVTIQAWIQPLLRVEAVV